MRFLLANGAESDAVKAKGWTTLRMAKGIFYSNTGKALSRDGNPASRSRRESLARDRPRQYNRVVSR